MANVGRGEAVATSSACRSSWFEIRMHGVHVSLMASKFRPEGRVSYGVSASLRGVQTRVLAAYPQQFVVCTGFDHAPVFHDDDTIGVPDR